MSSMISRLCRDQESSDTGKDDQQMKIQLLEGGLVSSFPSTHSSMLAVEWREEQEIEPGFLICASFDPLNRQLNGYYDSQPDFDWLRSC
ncbi:hypothetical protein BDV18DRAFT_134639 [Aspergillus unguis]